jgi:thiol:disulfide interchange protein
MRTRGLVAVVVALLFALPAQSASAPRMSLTSLANLPVVTTHPYDEHADADQAVAAAFAKARKSHKRVLIDLGGNWCGDCLVLANLMELPELKTFMRAHFEMVSVDVGRFNKNLQVPARFGITKRLEGVPAVLIVEPDGKTLVDAGHVSALADARHMTPQGLADWLAQWAKSK